MRKISFIGTSKKNLLALPKGVQEVITSALFMAMEGDQHDDVKPLKGKQFPGAKVLEVRVRHLKNAYRCIYTTMFKDVICVLHVFQKKSSSGIATPKKEIDLVLTRLKRAKDEYKG